MMKTKQKVIISIVFLLPLLLFIGCGEDHKGRNSKAFLDYLEKQEEAQNNSDSSFDKVSPIENSLPDLSDSYLNWCNQIDAKNPDLEIQNSEIPERIVTYLPMDVIISAESQERKSILVCLLLPIIAKVNNEVFESRQLLRLAWDSLNREEKNHLIAKMIYYDVIDGREAISYIAADLEEINEDLMRQAEELLSQGYRPSAAQLDLLEKRMGPIPPALTIIQAAKEALWGQSKWARQDNNLLGMQVFFRNKEDVLKYKNCRPAGEDANRCVIRYENLYASIYDQHKRLNTVEVYKTLITLRKEKSCYLNALDVLRSDTLKDYSQDPGRSYMDAMIGMVSRSSKIIKYDELFRERCEKYEVNTQMASLAQ